MNFFQILVNITTRYGFFPGIILFFKLKLKRFDRLKIPGIKVPVTLRKHTSDHSVFLQIFLKEEYAFNYETEINTIIDAGANAGYAAIYFASLFKKAEIISIEPETNNYELLKKNTSEIPKIKPLLAALWNTYTNMEVKNNGGHWVYSVEEKQTGTVSGLSVQDIMLMYNMKTIDIFKIDIEGSEKELFEKNYESWLPLTKYLIVETHDRMKKDCTKTIFRALDKYNFSCYINGENFIFVNNDIISKAYFL